MAKRSRTVPIRAKARNDDNDPNRRSGRAADRREDAGFPVRAVRPGGGGRVRGAASAAALADSGRLRCGGVSGGAGCSAGAVAFRDRFFRGQSRLLYRHRADLPCAAGRLGRPYRAPTAGVVHERALGAGCGSAHQGAADGHGRAQHFFAPDGDRRHHAGCGGGVVPVRGLAHRPGVRDCGSAAAVGFARHGEGRRRRP